MEKVNTDYTDTSNAHATFSIVSSEILVATQLCSFMLKHKLYAKASEQSSVAQKWDDWTQTRLFLNVL